MEEILLQRTYNQKVFKLDKRRKRFKIHAGHIHYKNTKGEFIDSNFTVREQADGSWSMNQHNYHFSFPEYADEIFDFYNGYEGANHHIKVRPIAKHVKGIKVEDGILYKDAFGKGIDFKPVIQRSGARKLIIINENPGKDLAFDFELFLDEKSEELQYGLKKEEKEKINITDKELDLTNKTFRFGKDEKCSFVKRAIVWDSNKKRCKQENIKLTVFKKDGKTFLRKFILKEFFDDAVFPVMTDHPTDYYSTTADGFVLQYSESSWAACRDAATGNDHSYVLNSKEDAMAAGAHDDYYWWMVCRSFFYFDTSAIGGGSTVNSCKFNLHGRNRQATSVVVQHGTQADSLTTADFDAFSGDEYGHTVNWDMTQYNEITFNALGRNGVNKSGTTKICCREREYDFDDVDPQPGYPCKYENGCYYANQTGQDKDPYLDIEATTPPPSAPTVYTTYKPYNCYVEIRNKTFDLIKILNKDIKKLNWEYLRVGGYGRCSTTLAMNPEDIENYVAPDYEIRIYMDTNRGERTLVYRGFIEKYKPIITSPNRVQLQAYGYSAQLRRNEVIRTYEGMEVSEIVKDILDKDVLPKTSITYDVADIEASTFSPESLPLNTLVHSAMKMLGNLAGNYEWGVDTNLKFFFKKPIDDVYNFLRLKKEIGKFDEIYDYAGIINRIILQGGNDLFETINNTESQNLYGIRTKMISNSAIISSGTAQRYGSMLLLDTAGIIRRASITGLNNKILFEDNIPLGRIAVVKEPIRYAKTYNEDYYGNFYYGGIVSYEINKIKYTLTSEGVNTDLRLDQPRPDVAKTLRQFEFELDQVRNL